MRIASTLETTAYGDKKFQNIFYILLKLQTWFKIEAEKI
jgi:hypothetical protein